MNKRITLAIFSLVLLLLPSLACAQEGLTISEIVELGLENNPQIKAQHQEVEARKASWQASRRLFNPSLDYHLGKGESYDGTVERDIYGLSLSQYLENPLKRHHRIEVAEKDLEAAEYALRYLMLDVTFNVKKHCYMILLMEKKVELARENVRSLEEAHRLVATQVQLGETRELEGIKLLVEVMLARNDLNRVETDLELARQHLNALLGNSLSPSFFLKGELGFRSLLLERNALLTVALHTHPLISESEMVLEGARSQLGFIRSKRIPDPALGGFLNNELDGEIRGVGISLQIPLWNLGSKEIAEARSLTFKRENELEGLKLEMETEVINRINKLKLSAERMEIFNEGLLKQAEESMKISATSYREGEISLLEYLDSQRTYYSILTDHQDSLFEWNLNRAALERAVGEEIK